MSKFNLIYKVKLSVKKFIYYKLGYVPRKVEKNKIFDKEVFALRGSLYNYIDLDTIWMNEISKRSRLIFDVGVNTGQSTLMMLLNENVEKMVLVEPNHIPLSIAHENLMKNNLIHKTVSYCAFASDKNGEQIKFWSFYGDTAGSFSPNQAGTAKFSNSYQFVPTATLEYISDYFKIIPDFIKIDIEGAELMALNGCINLAKNNKITFLVEMHIFPTFTKQEGIDGIIKWCETVGYTPYYTKTKSVLNLDTTIEEKLRYHLLLIPKNTAFPEYL